MAAAGKGIPPARKNPAREQPLTVMVMGKVGKVRSFRVSRRLFFLTFLFFATYLPLSAYLVNRYFDLSRTGKDQQVRIERLEQDLLLSANTLARSKEHILFLEDYISQMEARGEGRAQQATSPEKGSEGAGAPLPGEQAQAKEEAIVSIEDLDVEKKGDRLLIHFKIVKLLPGDNSVGGYVHLAAKGREGSIRPEWVFPQTRWIDGFPEDFRLGQMFVIQRFKPMEGKLPLDEGHHDPIALEILVYDEAGGILLQEAFKIP